MYAEYWIRIGLQTVCDVTIMQVAPPLKTRFIMSTEVFYTSSDVCPPPVLLQSFKVECLEEDFK